MLSKPRYEVTGEIEPFDERDSIQARETEKADTDRRVACPPFLFPSLPMVINER
jgi:hypothetical protein